MPLTEARLTLPERYTLTFIAFVSAQKKGLMTNCQFFSVLSVMLSVQAWHHLSYLCSNHAYKRSLLHFKHKEFFKFGWVLKCIGGLSKLNHIWNLK